jgi:lysophospholipase L1-like esterase
VYLVAPQNTISGGARFAALAADLRAIADSSADIKFFDLRQALIDGGYTDGDQLMLSTVSTDGIHTNQTGRYLDGLAAGKALIGNL